MKTGCYQQFLNTPLQILLEILLYIEQNIRVPSRYRYHRFLSTVHRKAGRIQWASIRNLNLMTPTPTDLILHRLHT